LNSEILIEELKKGSEAAFRSLFDGYYALLVNVADGYLHNRQLSEEIADDVMFRIWEKRKELEIHTSLRNYLIQAVYNRCINHLKSIKHKPENPENKITDENSQYMAYFSIYNPLPPSRLLTSELETSINNAIEGLPAQCKKIFQLSRFNEMSYEEIANELKISVNTVKTQLKVALKKLRIDLKDYLSILIFILLRFF
jgi:RNA polymerase sigma-70 factor (ECF subfamily)